MSDHHVTLEERLQCYPRMQKSVEALLAIVEETSARRATADEAEFRVIETLRHMGHDLIQEWAEKQEHVQGEEFRAHHATAAGHGEKKLYWYTTFGVITLMERVFWHERHLVRPFSAVAHVMCQGYSEPLQRRITDFGADVAFGQVADKLEEHYGIRIPASAARTITARHAQAIYEHEQIQTEIPQQPGVACLIAETDGTMIPLVETDDLIMNGHLVDRRKTRTGRWNEARLALAHPKGSGALVFGCTLGGPDDAGARLLDCAIRSGLGPTTAVHCVGDGASWIAEQVDRVFGRQGSFLIDFYHLSEYLSAASRRRAPEDPDGQSAHYQHLMQDNQGAAVLEDLRPHVEPSSIPDEQAPIRCCYRYIVNRSGQFDYKGALANDLPIGSGEIESGHRYIIHKRLKIAGAWWKKKNAQAMLALRTLRANDQWAHYWKDRVTHKN
jgi:hypothetical protein